ncbi:hypothetical protein [Alicyclobacillus dauci]|uniref:Uncharacterized protein n=1 Tax=Alicyclobacillus dauci TaxID=1475485 RepID=A0ABY6YYC1_9BACL|nr:hypothetical protein [Alicyclobacillus dauci]WAH35622.1 hypothetical protein NZD86_15230 [Alicyclobacillus dauci]
MDYRLSDHAVSSAHRRRGAEDRGAGGVPTAAGEDGVGAGAGAATGVGAATGN